MADARQPFQVFLLESAKQAVQGFMAFARRGAFKVRAADAVRVCPRERRATEGAQRDHRAAGVIVAASNAAAARLAALAVCEN